MKLGNLAFLFFFFLAGCGVLPPREHAAPAQPLSLAERHNQLGLALAEAGRYGEAVTQFSAAVALEPAAAYLHNNLGFAQLRRGALAEAVAQFEEATRLDPAHPQAVVNLAAARAALASREKERQVAKPVKAEPAAKEETPTDLKLVQLAPYVYELASKVPPPVAKPTPVVAAPQRRYRLEVANGNGVRGMAHLVASRLAEYGLVHARLTNDKPFNKPVTEVHFRPGYEAEARKVAALLAATTRVVAGALPSGVDVRVVLGGDRRSAMPAQFVL